MVPPPSYMNENKLTCVRGIFNGCRFFSWEYCS